MDGSVVSETFARTGAFLAGRLRDGIAGGDLAALEALAGEPVALDDGQCLVAPGQTVQCASILVDGFVLRTVQNEGRRLIVGVNVPGDFLDLPAMMLQRLDYAVVAAGPARITQIGHAPLIETMRRRPALARALWFSTLLDGAIHRRWIRNFETLDAAQRIAHIYAELHHRLALIGRTSQRALRTPFTQTDLADMCGVSPIHANRAVARLRELGLGEIRRGDLYTENWRAIEAYARFDPAYLYGEQGAAI